jgi:hypothetical protein
MTTHDGTFPGLCAESAKDSLRNRKGNGHNLIPLKDALHPECDTWDPVETDWRSTDHRKRLSSPGQRQRKSAAKIIQKDLWVPPMGGHPKAPHPDPK